MPHSTEFLIDSSFEIDCIFQHSSVVVFFFFRFFLFEAQQKLEAENLFLFKWMMSPVNTIYGHMADTNRYEMAPNI